jgi:hypothetical protein
MSANYSKDEKAVNLKEREKHHSLYCRSYMDALRILEHHTLIQEFDLNSL